MIRTRPVLASLLFMAAVFEVLAAEEPQQWTLRASNPQGWAVYDPDTGLFHGTNGVFFSYAGAVLTSDSMIVDQASGQVFADGNVRIQREEQVWIGDHIVYNYKTSQIEARQFRTGKPPLFVEGEGLHAETADTNKAPSGQIRQPEISPTNLLLRATNAYVTMDDVSDPAVKIRAKSITVIPGKKLIARHAILEAAGIPIFYWAYYERNLGPRANNFNFHPGYRTSYGAFLLTRYQWFLNEELDGILHADYRTRRGPGVGPDLNLHMGKWGNAFIRYYYVHDYDPDASITITNGNPFLDNAERLHIPADRQEVAFEWIANPREDLSFRSQAHYQTDVGILHDFVESEYRRNPQPPTYVEGEKVTQNFGLDLYAQPRLNNFLETIERLPDVRLTGYRQQLWESPLYYDSESSLGYFRRRFADTNQLYPLVGPYTTTGQRYAAARADTFHQITLPETFFGWLNLTPRVGGRFTYYSSAEGPGAMTDEAYRGVFNTGAELSFKASRVWPAFQSKIFEADGLRHIMEPSVNYVYVPTPNRAGTNEIPQFDFELPSLRLLPLEFPEYNSIDTIDEQNTFRLGLRNKLQTKRGGKIVDIVDWDLYADWYLHPQPPLDNGLGLQDQVAPRSHFSDVYSDLVMRPRSWLTFESLTRFDSSDGDLRFALNTATFQPSPTWNWSVSHFYLRQLPNPPTNSPVFLGQNESIFTSSFFFNLNENWSARATHRFDVLAGRMQEQIYTVYRDFRGWTGALSFRVRENPSGPGTPTDFGVAFTFSIKAYPRYGLGTDAVRPYYLLGGG